VKLFSKTKNMTESPQRRRALAEASGSQAEGGQFRRNRTLARTFKSQDDAGRTDLRVLQRHRKHWARRLFWVIAVMVFIAIAVLQLNAFVRVDINQASGSTPTTSSQKMAYEKKITEYLRANLAQNFRSMIDMKALNAYVTKNIPELQSVDSVAMGGLGETTFTVTARTPIAAWMVDGKTYFVDKDGIVFVNNLGPTPKITIEDKSGYSSSDSSTIASQRFLSFCGAITGQLEANGIAVSKLIIPELTVQQIQAVTSNGLIIKISIDRSAGEQAEDAANAIQYLRQQGKSAAYVDVRASGRAYYK
jgi:cell division septal protein FtsQ